MTEEKPSEEALPSSKPSLRRRVALRVLGEERVGKLDYARSVLIKRLPVPEGIQVQLDPSRQKCSTCRYFDVESAQQAFVAHEAFAKVQTALTPSQMTYGVNHHGGPAWSEFGACTQATGLIVDPDHRCSKWRYAW